MDRYAYYHFERCVGDIFAEAGYSIERDVPIDGQHLFIDVVAKLSGATYYVEIKYTAPTDLAASKICNLAEKHGATPILVTVREVGDKREYYKSKYDKLILIDLANLLFAVKDHTELRNRLISILPNSIDSIEPEENFLHINALQHNNYTQALIGEMHMCVAGRGMARSYEKLCKMLLENIFSDDLALWKEQQQSNNKLYRFDLLCRIKDGEQKTFWKLLERYFTSKYIIFEFKNHKEEITQREIYTTEKYLYAKALRSVAIIIAANGYDKNAYWASKGCLRENGKLILLLDTDDLIKMNEMKLDQEDPSEYLLGKLDDLLFELEK